MCKSEFQVGDIVVVKPIDEIDRSIVDYDFVSPMNVCVGVPAIVDRIITFDGNPAICLVDYETGKYGVFADSFQGTQWMFAPQWLEFIDDEPQKVEEINMNGLEGLL